MSIFTVTVPYQSEELGLLSDIDSTSYGSTSSASEFASFNPLSSDEPEDPNVQIKRNKDGGRGIDVQDQHTQHNGRGIYVYRVKI